MKISRPVVAFALLKKCSEVLRTDLLGGIALLVKPLVIDLGGQLFSAEILSERISSSYGLLITPQALTDFLPRFIEAGIVIEKKISESATEAVFAQAQETQFASEKNDENDFQSILDKFLDFCRLQFAVLDLTIPEDQLISGLLVRLATFDFKAIQIKPDRTKRDSAPSNILAGPKTKKDIDIEGVVSDDSKLDVLVAAFVSKLHDSDPATFELLIKVAEGALGAELVFDLRAPRQSFELSRVTIALDTPILLSLLDFSDQQHHRYAEEVVKQIRRSHAIPAVYRHSIEEAESVLYAVKKEVMNYGQAYGPTAERLQDPTYLAYFETMMGAIERRLIERGIKVIEPTIKSAHRYFEEDLKRELTKYLSFLVVDRRLTRERDAQSVAETMRLRAGVTVPLEKLGNCKYLFLTSNPELQDQARSFLLSEGKIHKKDLPPIITDRYFAGLSWLLFGGSSASSLTTAKLLANCATALRARPDVIAKTKSFLAIIDPQQATHFEALMTKERAARYLTEITLGDSLLITSDNARAIYEKVETIAAEKVARAKDQYYGEQLADKQRQIEALIQDLANAKDVIEALQADSTSKGGELKYQIEQVTLLSDKLKEDKHLLQIEGEEINSLKEQVSILATAAEKSAEEALRAKRTAIIRALNKSKRDLWVARFIILAFFIALGFALGYLDNFIVPNVPVAYQDTAKIVLVIFQVGWGSLGFWVFTEQLFGKYVWRYARKSYQNELSYSGYSRSEPEFELDFEKFAFKERNSANDSTITIDSVQ